MFSSHLNIFYQLIVVVVLSRYTKNPLGSYSEKFLFSSDFQTYRFEDHLRFRNSRCQLFVQDRRTRSSDSSQVWFGQFCLMSFIHIGHHHSFAIIGEQL